MPRSKLKCLFRLLPLWTALIMGCSPGNFKQIEIGEDNSKQGSKVRPACEISEVDFQLDSQIIFLEVTNARGLKFGFNLLTQWLKLFEVKMEIKESTLALTTDVREFLRPDEALSPAEGKDVYSEKESGFSFNLGQIAVGVHSFKMTPLYEVLKRALGKSLSSSLNQIRKVDPLWSSIILEEPTENHFIIPAGANAGIQIGDEFEVYNVVHSWKKVPCASEYRMKYHTTKTPLAILRVEDQFALAPNSAILTLKEQLNPELIEVGAYIYVKQLAANRSPQSLKRSAVLREIKPFIMSFKSKNNPEVNVDLTQDLRQAFQTIAPENGLYLKSPTH